MDPKLINEYKIYSPSRKRNAIILNYGCVLKEYNIILKNGSPFNIVLSHKTIGEYIMDDKTYMGAFVGRFCGRIKNSRFCIGDKEYKLTPNNGNSHLHGVLSRVIFNVKKHTNTEVVFEYDSPNGEDGFPGNIRLEVSYAFQNETLVFSVSATSDVDTIFAPSNHTYFSLSHSDNIFKSTLLMNAHSFYEIDSKVLKTGKVIKLNDCPLMDFRVEKSLSAISDYNSNVHLKNGHGLDHTFIFNETPSIRLENSTLKLTITTSEKNVHLYSGGFLSESCSHNDRGQMINDFDGIAFESETVGENLEPNIIRSNEPFTTSTSWFVEEK